AVGGSHAYAGPGTFAAIVQIADDAPGTATATAAASVSVTTLPPPPPPTPSGGGPSSSSASASQTQVNQVALDALLVPMGLLTDNAGLVELGLVGYSFVTSGQPGGVQSQLQAEFFRDLFTDLALGSLLSTP